MPASHSRAILVVEDEPDILITLHHLTIHFKHGYVISTFRNALDVLSELSLRAIPLVITKYSLPGMNGIELTKAIKRAAPLTCVVLVTAFSTKQLEQQSKEAGVDYYLPKPFALEQLEEIVRATLI